MEIPCDERLGIFSSVEGFLDRQRNEVRNISTCRSLVDDGGDGGDDGQGAEDDEEVDEEDDEDIDEEEGCVVCAWCMCVCVCVHVRQGLNNKWCEEPEKVK
mgnify:CR=1 FL=1